MTTVAISSNRTTSSNRSAAQFIKGLAAGSKILDCGCGPGMDTERFVQLGYKVTAIDLSDRFVALTKKPRA